MNKITTNREVPSIVTIADIPQGTLFYFPNGNRIYIKLYMEGKAPSYVSLRTGEVYTSSKNGPVIPFVKGDQVTITVTDNEDC